jgi:hypothetical protein
MEKSRPNYVQIASLVVGVCGLVVAYTNKNKSRELECRVETSCLDNAFQLSDLDTNLQAAYKGRTLSNICFIRLGFRS